MAVPFPHAEPDWRDDAACRDADIELFFSHDPGQIQEALSYCRRCPVQEECLDDSLRHGERYGVWGGTTEQGRRVYARQRRRVA